MISSLTPLSLLKVINLKECPVFRGSLKVDFDNKRILLSQYKTKSKKARVIPIVPFLAEILLSLKNEKTENSKVFHMITENVLKKKWNALQNQISCGYINDGTKLRFHDLRHVYAQSLLNQGVQLEDIQVLLGHQSFVTTQKRYAMFSRPDLQDKTEKIQNVIQLNRKTG